MINKTISDVNWVGFSPVTFQGTGLIVLGGNNTYSVDTTIAENTRVQAKHSSAFGTSNVSMKNGSTLQFGTDNLILSNDLVLDSGSSGVPGSITIDTLNHPSTLLKTIKETGDNVMKLIIKGKNILTFNNIASHTGGTEVQTETTLKLGLANALATGPVNLSGTEATLDMTAASQNIPGLSGSNQSRVILGDNTLTLNQNSTFNGTFNSNANGRVIVDGSSTLTLGGINRAPGTLQENANSKTVMTLGATFAPTTALDLAAAGATFDASASGEDMTLSSLKGGTNTSFKWGNQSLMINEPSVFDGTLEGGLNSQVILNADLTLGGQNLNTSDWTINAATLTMKAGSTLPTHSSLFLNSNSAVFDMHLEDQTLGLIADNANPNSRIELGDSILTLDMTQSSAFSGQIKGVDGKVVKQGLGFLNLSGNNPFSGGLTIKQGGITASSSTALGTGPVALHDNTTLTIATPLTITNPVTLQGGRAILQTDSPTTIDQIIDGAGGFDKRGSAALTLTKANTYAEDTHIKEGSLVVDGSIGNVTVEAGTILTGVGSVGTVVNNGIVTPSDPVGQFTVRGDYLPSSQGTAKIAINPDSSNKLHVEGAAKLNNSILFVNVTPGDNSAYENHPPLEVLSSDHPVDRIFGAVQSSHVRYKWKADYETDPNKVFLNFDGHVSFEEIVRSVSDNTNPIASAHYFDNLPQPITDPDLNNIISIFNSQPEAHGIMDIFEEISPDELLLTEETATLVNEINGFRMHYLRDMTASPTAAAGFTTAKTQKATSFINRLKQAFGQMRADDRQARGPSMSLNIEQQMQDNALMMGPKGGIWIQGFGNISRQKATGINMGYRNKMAGSLIGIDYKLKPDLFVGVSFGYDQSRIKWIHALSKGKIKDYLASVYSTWFHNKFYINAALTGAYNRYNIRRRMTFATVLDRTAHSRHKGYVLAPSLEIGHGFTLFNGIEVVPFIRGDYVHIHENGYEEKGAGALNLQIRSKTNTALRTEPGLNFYQHFKREEGLITAKVKLSYVNKHPLKNGKITANLVGQPGTFLASSSNKTQHQVSPGISLDYKTNSGFFFSTAYDAQLGAKYKAHEISFKIGTKF